MSLLACGGAGSGSGPSDAGSNEGIPGYVHTLARSRFQIGRLESEYDQSGMHKVTGSHGVFATELASQAATAVPDGDVLTLAGSRTPQDAATQGQALVQYLVGAGLEADQIASVHEDEMVQVDPGATPTHPTLSLEVPVLSRQWNGIPIDDSTASAALSDSERSYEEQVFWPAIGQDVVDDIRKFQAMLADPSQSSRFMQAIPPSASGGAIVIHHTSWYWQGPFRAVACYRVVVEGQPLYFDMTGSVVLLPMGTTDAG